MQRTQHVQLRRSLNMLAAILFLTLGILIPLVSAINQQRWAASPGQADAIGQDQHSPPVSRPTLVQAAPLVQPESQEDVPAAATVTTMAAIASLIPIVATPGLAAQATAPTGIAADPGMTGAEVQAGQSRSGPILMYHYIRSVDQASDPMGYELSVTAELFDQHMAWLVAQGYTGVSMQTLLRCTGRISAAVSELCPAAPVALTFDDGYSDAYTDALPILQRYGFRATFYIVSDFVGQPGYMGWNELAVLRDAGMELGSHSVSHPDLTQLDQAELERQIRQSKAELEQHLNIRVTSFCYPTGKYDMTTVAQVELAGYENATTTRWDNDDSDVLALPRRRVAGATTAEEFGWIVSN